MLKEYRKNENRVQKANFIKLAEKQFFNFLEEVKKFSKKKLSQCYFKKNLKLNGSKIVCFSK